MPECTDRLCPDRFCWDERECPTCGYLWLGCDNCPECADDEEPEEVA